MSVWWTRSLPASLCFMASEVPHGLPFCLQPSLLSPSAPSLLLEAGSGSCPGLQVAAVGGRSPQNSFKVRWKPTCQPCITGSLDTATGTAGSAPGCMGTEQSPEKLQMAKRMSLTSMQWGAGETWRGSKGCMIDMFIIQCHACSGRVMGIMSPLCPHPIFMLSS